MVGLASRILVRIAEEDAVAGLARDVFDATNDLGVEGVGDVGDDDAEGVGLSGFEAAGDGIREVVERGHGIEDALLSLRPHRGRSVDHRGDRGDGDVGQHGDVAHRVLRSGGHSRYGSASLLVKDEPGTGGRVKFASLRIITLAGDLWRGDFSESIFETFRLTVVNREVYKLVVLVNCTNAVFSRFFHVN